MFVDIEPVKLTVTLPIELSNMARPPPLIVPLRLATIGPDVGVNDDDVFAGVDRVADGGSGSLGEVDGSATVSISTADKKVRRDVVADRGADAGADGADAQRWTAVVGDEAGSGVGDRAVVDVEQFQRDAKADRRSRRRC